MKQLTNVIMLAAATAISPSCVIDDGEEAFAQEELGDGTLDSVEAGVVDVTSFELDRVFERDSAGEIGEPTPQGVCTGGILCGRVRNNLDQSIRISLDWRCGSATFASLGHPCVQGIQTLGPHSGRGGFGTGVDVDAFEVRSGCTATVDINGSTSSFRAGWWKINNVEVATVIGMACFNG